jgi:hypothetical protein
LANVQSAVSDQPSAPPSEQAATTIVQIPALSLQAELVDAAITLDQSLQPKSESRLAPQSPFREDNFDWISRRARWAQHPAWHGTSEISNSISHGRVSQINARRFHRDTDADGVNEELLDEIFADGELNLLL